MPKPDMLNLRTAESTVTLTEKPQGVDYSRVRDLTLPEYFSLSKRKLPHEIQKQYIVNLVDCIILEVIKKNITDLRNT